MSTHIRTRFLGLIVCCLASVTAARAEKLVLVAGGGDGGDGSSARTAKLQMPFGVDFDRAGNLFLVEFIGQRVRKIDGKGVLHTIAGTGEKGYGGDDGPAAKAKFNSMHSLVVTPGGDIYVADTWNNRVRKIDGRSGEIRSIAGIDEKGFSGDGGPATKAKFSGIHCLALDAKGEKLYLADLDNRRIRVVDLNSGVVETVAGNGKRGVPKDGAEARKRRWSIRAPWRWMRREMSTSWSAADMLCASWTPKARFAPSPAPARKASAVTTAMRCAPSSTVPSIYASIATATC